MAISLTLSFFCDRGKLLMNTKYYSVTTDAVATFYLYSSDNLSRYLSRGSRSPGDISSGDDGRRRNRSRPTRQPSSPTHTYSGRHRSASCSPATQGPGTTCSQSALVLFKNLFRDFNHYLYHCPAEPDIRGFSHDLALIPTKHWDLIRLTGVSGINLLFG